MTLPTIKKALEILKEQRLIEFSILNGNIPEVDGLENCGARLLSPEEILHLGNALMTPSFFTANEAELLDSIEQVIKASLEVRTKEAESLRENLFRALKQKTPQNSKRVLILEALQLEYHSKLKEALQVYSSVDETNSFVQKRIVTISHELNKEEGIRKLISYLNSHPLDTEAWLRLFYYYKEIGMIDEAVHCLDELLLLRPLNYEYFELYAEFLLQNYQKSKDHNVLARKMLLKSLELTGFKHGKARKDVLEKISQCNAVINDGHSEQLEILLKKL